MLSTVKSIATSAAEFSSQPSTLRLSSSYSMYLTHMKVSLPGACVCSFRHFWACLPWPRATFHAISPDAIADLGSHILNADRAVLQLLHALDWAPVLRQLGHVSSRDPQLAREGCRWGTQLCCLALRAHILLTPSELPGW